MSYNRLIVFGVSKMSKDVDGEIKEIKGVNTSRLTNRVKELRESVNMSAYSLAVLCGFVTANKNGDGYMVNSRSIYNIEDGKGINLVTALAIYKAFKSQGLATSIEDVFDLENFEPNDVR